MALIICPQCGEKISDKANLDSKGNLDTKDFDVHPLGTELDY